MRKAESGITRIKGLWDSKKACNFLVESQITRITAVFNTP